VSRLEIVKGRRGWYWRRRNEAGKIVTRCDTPTPDFVIAMRLAAYEAELTPEDEKVLYFDRFDLLREQGVEDPRALLKELGSL
jgi:hypothetical protein